LKAPNKIFIWYFKNMSNTNSDTSCMLSFI
jgi:hypothetical protein